MRAYALRLNTRNLVEWRETTCEAWLVYKRRLYCDWKFFTHFNTQLVHKTQIASMAIPSVTNDFQYQTNIRFVMHGSLLIFMESTKQSTQASKSTHGYISPKLFVIRQEHPGKNSPKALQITVHQVPSHVTSHEASLQNPGVHSVSTALYKYQHVQCKCSPIANSQNVCTLRQNSQDDILWRSQYLKIPLAPQTKLQRCRQTAQINV